MPDLLALGTFVLGLVVGLSSLGFWRFLRRWIQDRLRNRRYVRNRRRVDKAEIARVPASAPTHPPSPRHSSVVRIDLTAWDDRGRRIDGVKVTFLTDNGTFATGTMFETITSSSGARAPYFLAMNPRQSDAGIAEAYLDVSAPRGRPGVARITAIVERPGSSILLETTVAVIGPTSTTGLALNVLPDEIECGETVRVEVAAIDALGAPVVDGTVIYLSCDDGARFVDLRAGSDGIHTDVATDRGAASALLATDPMRPGVHTVIAHVMAPDPNGQPRPSAVTSKTYMSNRPPPPPRP